MADEIITSEPQADAPKEPSRIEERITQLSDKTRIAEEARIVAEAKAAEAEKKAAFSEGYADFLSQNPAAKDFKQQIQEKFMSGMPVEDAAYAVLGKAGKLGGSPKAESTIPAGGSAATTLTDTVKTPSEMTTAEKREALSKELLWS